MQYFYYYIYKLHIVDLAIFITFILTFISNRFSQKIKRLSDIKSISNIMQIDALFDVLVWYFKDFENLKIIVLFFSITFPVNVILNGLFPKFRNIFYFWFILISSLILYFKVDYRLLGEEKGYYLIPCITLELLAIIVCSYNVLKHKRIIQPVNYLYYLMLGFMILDFFWYLGFQGVIMNSFQNFWPYHYFYVLYLTIFRFIYIYYVAKYLRFWWIASREKRKLSTIQ